MICQIEVLIFVKYGIAGFGKPAWFLSVIMKT
uniref:Uncharacterized protein n=1 Tax=Candidatus Kentrum sp. FW TaxID=2126338 RepID=A0A450U3Y3_9GAMM|nr:MAG: hypothetical protein BECKFW1821C_GA0114237_11492 [Candidatus Kentron sp. FW]